MDLKEAKKFYNTYSGRVIFREFALRRIHKKDQVYSYKIECVKPKSKMWKFIGASPTVFQEYISKKMEYRVVVLGHECFVCTIDSQSGAKSKMDWRAYELEKVKFSAGVLPVNLQKKLIEMAKRRGLKFCSFDLVQDPNGDFYFLEMNRPGSWLFIEGLTGLKISQAIVRALAKPEK